MEDASYSDMQARMNELEQERAALEQAMAAKRNERKKELYMSFREQAFAEGFSLAEVIGNRLTGGRGRGVSTSGTEYPTWVLKSDPSLTYVRGRLPNWMQEQMGGLGLDPKSREDRERFKQEHMELAS